MARQRNLLSDPTLLEAALEGLTLQKRRIDDQIAEIRAILGRRGPGRPAKRAGETGETKGPAATKKRRRRRLSETARKRIAAAQKKRWAEYRKKAESANG